MGIFAKLFETEYGQVLFTADYDCDKEDIGSPYVITARCSDLKGVTPSISFSYETKEQRESQFEGLGQDDAMRVEKELRAVVGGFMS